jgi:hypothetical protein
VIFTRAPTGTRLAKVSETRGFAACGVALTTPAQVRRSACAEAALAPPTIRPAAVRTAAVIRVIDLN